MTSVHRARIALATLPLLLGLAGAGCSSGAGDTTSAQPDATTGSPTETTNRCATPEAGANAQDTASYRMLLSASGPEKMLTQSQVDAQGLTEGELLMGGRMEMRSPGAAQANGHVEVAICDLATGSTVSGADVSMQFIDGSDARPMQVMEMRGLDEPATESHYGNNTVMPARAYAMRVTLDGESAEFAMPAMH